MLYLSHFLNQVYLNLYILKIQAFAIIWYGCLYFCHYRIKVLLILEHKIDRRYWIGYKRLNCLYIIRKNCYEQCVEWRCKKSGSMHEHQIVLIRNKPNTFYSMSFTETQILQKPDQTFTMILFRLTHFDSCKGRIIIKIHTWQNIYDFCSCQLEFDN